MVLWQGQVAGKRTMLYRNTCTSIDQHGVKPMPGRTERDMQALQRHSADPLGNVAAVKVLGAG